MGGMLTVKDRELGVELVDSLLLFYQLPDQRIDQLGVVTLIALIRRVRSQDGVLAGIKLFVAVLDISLGVHLVVASWCMLP